MKTFNVLAIAQIFLIINVCIFKVDAIKCFQCSAVDPGCANLTRNDTDSIYYKECPIKTFCRKIEHTILDSNKLVRVNRACGWELFKSEEDNCYKNDDDFKYEKVCQCFTDGCNAAVQMKYSQLLPVLVLFIYLVRKVA